MNLGEITRESIEAYHALDCVSHSKLETFRDKDRGPARYHGMFIAKTIPREESTTAMDVGQALDSLVLEKRTVFDVLPTTYGPDAKKFTMAANECKAIVRGIEARGLIPLKADDAATVRAMHDSVMANPIAAALLSRGEAQCSMRYQFGPFRVQIRPDWWNRDGITLPDGTAVPAYLCDLKSAEDMDQFLKNRRAFGYSRQAALYREITRMVLAGIGSVPLEEVATPDFLFLVVFKTAPIECVVFRESDEEIAEATNEVIDDLRRLKTCYAENVWPGSPAGISTLPAMFRRAA